MISRQKQFIGLVLLLVGTLSAAPATRPMRFRGGFHGDSTRTVRALKLVYRPKLDSGSKIQTLAGIAGTAYQQYVQRNNVQRYSWAVSASVEENGDMHARVNGRGINDPYFELTLSEKGSESAIVLFQTSEQETRNLYEPTLAALKGSIAEVAGLGDAQVAEELSKAEKELSRVQEMLEQVSHLTQSREQVRREIVAEKLKALELEKQKLEMELAAKKARGAAARQQMQEIVREAAATRPASADAVLEQLQKSVEAREQSLARMKQMHATGTVSAAELSQAEESLLDAKARLAERKEALSQPANVDLLNRLGQEVALVAVDQAELAARLQEVSRRLPPDYFENLTEQDLNRLNPEYFGLGAPATSEPPLARDLKKRETDLQRRILALHLSAVEPTEAPATQRGDLNP